MNPGATKQFDPVEVLERAMELFWSQGYESTGMAQLVEHLGIGRQSLYNEFGDKRGLFLAALRAYIVQSFGHISTVLERPGSPLGNLRALCAEWVQMAESESCPGCLLANTAAEFGSRDPEVHGLLMNAMVRQEDAFCGAFQRAQDAGELPGSAEPRDFARLLVSTGAGVAVYSRLSGSNHFVKSAARAMSSLLDQA